MFQTLTANKVGQQRRESLHGKNYVVIPVRMIRQGVLNGSRGPLLYTANEIQRSAQAWNNVPIVVNHPKNGDRFISARSPSVLNKSGVGYIFNATYSDGNLDAEAWVDIDRLQTVNSSLAAKVRSGERLEVSTGLGTENESAQGTYNNKRYDYIARNFAPDHLALLSNEKGACSLEDGCGLAVNSEFLEEMQLLVNQYNAEDTDKPFSDWLVHNCKGTNNKDGKECNCGCGGTQNKVEDEEVDFTSNAVIELDFVANNVSFDFQPTINADEIGWRTLDGGAKVYIGKNGEVRAGGPKGEVISKGKGTGPKARLLSGSKSTSASSVDKKESSSSDSGKMSGAARGKIKEVEVGGKKLESATVVDLPDYTIGGNLKTSSSILGDWVSHAGKKGNLVHIDPSGKSITLKDKEGNLHEVDPRDTKERDASLAKFKQKMS